MGKRCFARSLVEFWEKAANGRSNRAPRAIPGGQYQASSLQVRTSDDETTDCKRSGQESIALSRDLPGGRRDRERLHELHTRDGRSPMLFDVLNHEFRAGRMRNKWTR